MASIPVTPPPPPEVAAQMRPQGPLMMEVGRSNGGGAPSAVNLTALIAQKVAELEKWAGDIMPMLEQVDQTSLSFLIPIAQAGKALQARVQELQQRASGGAAMPGVTAGQENAGPDMAIPSRAVA